MDRVLGESLRFPMIREGTLFSITVPQKTFKSKDKERDILLVDITAFYFNQIF